MREVTGSSPVSSTIKTAVFERKQRFFVTFCLLFQIKRPCVFRMTTVSTTDREKMGLRRCVASGGPFVYYAGSPWSTCQCRSFFPFFPGGDLRLHLPDQFGQLRLTLGLCFRVHVPGHAPPVDLWGVATLPQVVVDLRDTPGARFTVLALDRLKGSPAGRFQFLFLRRLCPGDGPVDFVRRLLPHFVGDMGVFNVVALDTWPMTVDNVFTSIPCSRALVAKVCRRS